MRLIEFFEGAGRRLSMSRLLVFLAFWPSCYVLVTSPTETTLGIFLGAFVANYVGGKGADIFMGSDKLASSDVNDSNPGSRNAGSVLEGASSPSSKPKKRPF